MTPRLRAALDATGAPWLADEPLSRHTTLGVGGRTPALVLPRDGGEAARVLAALADLAAPYRVLGAGSNLIADDDGLDFVVVSTAALATPPRFDGTRVEAGAGVALPRLSREAAERGLGGLEFAIGIPGSVGGGLRMNAGAWGSEMAAVVDEVIAVLPGAGREAPCPPRFGYRDAGLVAGALVTRVGFRLQPGAPGERLATVERLLAERRRTQPVAARSAGCAFRNPRGDRAGRLIDACGLKGLSRGAAVVSERHANFILNRGGARAADVLALLAEVQARVEGATGVRLEPEVVIWRREGDRPIYPGDGP